MAITTSTHREKPLLETPHLGVDAVESLQEAAVRVGRKRKTHVPVHVTKYAIGIRRARELGAFCSACAEEPARETRVFASTLVARGYVALVVPTHVDLRGHRTAAEGPVI